MAGPIIKTSNLTDEIKVKNHKHSNMAANDPHFVKEFIELYRTHKCLWKMDDPSYTNKAHKRQAYEELVQLYETVDDEATADTVRSKINNLRSAFRKERKKIHQAERDGIDYTPGLWYYTRLLFLVDQETACRGEDFKDIHKIDFINTDNDLEDVELANRLLPETIISLSRTSSPNPRKAAKRKKDSLFFEKATEMLSKTDDEFQTIGANVAWKLRRMSEDQRNTAEHLINTILYYGITNKLNHNSTVVLRPSE